MKSDNVNRLLVVVALLMLAVVLAVLMLTAWGVMNLKGFTQLLSGDKMAVRVLLGILFLFLLIFTLFVMACVFRIGKEGSKSVMNTLRSTEAGTSFISNEAIIGIIQRQLKLDSRVKSGDCVITPVADGITADVRLTAFAGGDLAQLCSDLQDRIITEIEGSTGIPVRSVSVSIVQTIDSGSTQVERRVR